MIEAAKAAIMAVREADNPVNNARPLHAMPRSGGPALTTDVDWKVVDKYQELCNFEKEVKNISLLITILHRKARGPNNTALARPRGDQVHTNSE